MSAKKPTKEDTVIVLELSYSPEQKDLILLTENIREEATLLEFTNAYDAVENTTQALESMVKELVDNFKFPATQSEVKKSTVNISGRPNLRVVK